MGAERYDVIVVGGGPVGMGLAIDLGQRGVKVCVIERHAEPQKVPKGQNLTQRTMEHFAAWGCEDELRAARIVPRDYAIGGMTSYGTLLSPYHYDWLQRELVRPYYYTDNERLPQYETEAVLRRRAAQIGSVDLRYGWRANGFTQDRSGVSVTATCRDSDEMREWQASFVVGCDGARSIIREAAEISQTRSDHDRLMVLLVFRSPELHELLERYPGKQFYCILHPELEGYWLFFGRVDLGTTWFFHAPVPMNTTRDNFDFKAYVQRAAGAEFDLDLEYVGFWDLRFAVADRYRNGRAFIAGDAAHSHPPYGGYGVNTGFEDARNLAWKLAARLEGWGGAVLLDSYQAERRPVFESTARDFIEYFIREDRQFLSRYNPDEDRRGFEVAWSQRYEGSFEVNSFEPNYEGSPVVIGEPGGKPSAVGRHEFRARAGHHLAPAGLGDGRLSYQAFGNGFTLFDFGGDATISTSFAVAARQLGLPLEIISDNAAPARDLYEADLVLVRPDNFVAWSDGPENCDAAQILKQAIGQA
jgi:4-hydroxyisophthalate hydroxylase